MSIIYDNFSGGTIDANKWLLFNSSQLVQTSGHIQVTGIGAWDVTGLISKTAFPRNSFMGVKIKVMPLSGTQDIMVGLQSHPTTLGFTSTYTVLAYFSSGGLTYYVNGGGGPSTSYNNGVEYELIFKYNGPNIDLYINGGIYTDQLLVSTPDVFSQYIVLDSYQGMALLTGVSYDSPSTRFGSSASVDGTSVDSTANLDTIVSVIQGIGSDVYFDSTGKISRVDSFYTHEAGRQDKRIVHRYPTFVGQANWAEFVQDGTWQKTMVVAHDFDGATAVMPRSAIGTGEDLTHSDGTMNLNT